MEGIKNVVVHNLSPGMVTTELLMSGDFKINSGHIFDLSLAQLLHTISRWRHNMLVSQMSTRDNVFKPIPNLHMRLVKKITFLIDKIWDFMPVMSLTGNDTPTAKFFINCLAEPAETVADELVPKVRKVAQDMKAPGSGKSQYIRYLTKFKAYSQILGRLVLGRRKSKYVPEDA